MIFLILFFIIIFFISFLVMKISYIVSNKKMLDMKKMISFECGFDLISSSQIPFSIQFYMIMIIFLIFDIELVLLIPMIKTLNFSNYLNWFLIILTILLILILGIFYEWNQGILNWTN